MARPKASQKAGPWCPSRNEAVAIDAERTQVIRAFEKHRSNLEPYGLKLIQIDFQMMFSEGTGPEGLSIISVGI
jgi:hypothetical protein